MVADLEETGKENHKRTQDADLIHNIQVVENSQLQNITGCLAGSINSAHHQAIEVLGESLVANAYSSDKVIESITWKNNTDKPPLLGVQWHPERMLDKENNPLSNKIRSWFLAAATTYVYEHL